MCSRNTKAAITAAAFLDPRRKPVGIFQQLSDVNRPDGVSWELQASLSSETQFCLDFKNLENNLPLKCRALFGLIKVRLHRKRCYIINTFYPPASLSNTETPEGNHKGMYRGTDVADLNEQFASLANIFFPSRLQVGKYQTVFTFSKYYFVFVFLCLCKNQGLKYLLQHFQLHDLVTKQPQNLIWGTGTSDESPL